MKAFILILIVNGQSHTPIKVDTYADKATCEAAGKSFTDDLRSKTWMVGHFVCVPAGGK